MIILEDTRQQLSKHSLKNQWFARHGIKVERCRLFVGDYTLPTNQSVCVDTKKDLHELASNVGQQHERFRRELIRAQEAGIHLVILCEHGHGIHCLEDVLFWRNPREIVRKRINGHWTIVHQKVMQGDVLYRILCTMQRKYGVQFLFCDKEETGQKIVELLGGRNDG